MASSRLTVRSLNSTRKRAARGSESSQSRTPRPSADDLLEVGAVDGQVEGDGVAERHVGPQLLRLGEADLGLGVKDLGDDLHRVGEARHIGVLEHPDGVDGRPGARQAQPGLAGDATEDAGHFVQPAVGEFCDLELEVADVPGGRDLVPAESNCWATLGRSTQPPHPTGLSRSRREN